MFGLLDHIAAGTADGDETGDAAQVRRAAALRRAGRLKPALALLVAVLEGDRGHRGAWLELALCLTAAGSRAEARAAFDRLSGDGGDAETWRCLAGALHADGRAEAAEACLRRALALRPGDGAVLLDLAAAQGARGAFAEAADTCRIALALGPAAAAHAALGEALAALGRIGEAGEEFSRALTLDEGCAAARLGRARLAMLSGDLAEAWAGRPPRRTAALPGEAWDGRDCPGRSLLALADGTLADTIQFVRFVPLLAARGAHVILAVQPPLAALLAALPEVERVVPLDRPLPDADLHVALSDIPGLLGCSLDLLPRAPYLPLPGERRRVVAPPECLLKIGLAWQTEVPFAGLLALAARPDAAFFSLQTGPRAQDATALAHPALVTDLAPTIRGLPDLAARIAEMDLVIAADGLVAHLAGALGRPVWLLLDAAADPQWMLEREDSPWYPGMRLFRRQHGANWTAVIDRVAAALPALLDEARAQRRADAPADDSPKAVQRALLARHLTAGDLVIDVGAGDGAFALEAGARCDVQVLAVEADGGRAELLADVVALAGLEETVEVVHAAAAESAGRAVVTAEPRCGGRRVFALPDWVRGGVATLPLDVMIAERPHLAGRRLIVRLRARGAEATALAGLWEALLLYNVAAVAFEYRDGDATAQSLLDSGYSLWRLPGAAGAPLPFESEAGPVLALAPGIEAAAEYGAEAELAALHSLAEARRLAEEALAAQTRGDLTVAAARYGLALARHPGMIDANANLGSLLRRAGRPEAAAALTRRALAAGGTGGPLWSNLGNALRDMGRLDEAEGAFMKALAADPADPDVLYNLGLLKRDCGLLREAKALFQRSLALKPDAGRRWDLAAAFLRSEPPGSAFAELAGRPRRSPPPPLPEWDGGDCDGAAILVQDDGDIIETVLLARFLPLLSERGAWPVVECAPPLARLLAGLPGIAVAPHGEPAPDCALHTRLADLPALLGITPATLPAAPYLAAEAPPSPPGRPLRVGLAWAGRPGERFCPLSGLLRLATWPDVVLASLQRGPRAVDLAATGAGAFVDDLAGDCEDLADVAAVIAGLDLVIGADAIETHIAAAMGKPAWVLLPAHAAWYWPDGRESTPWYPGLRVFPQGADGSWETALTRLSQAVGAMAAGRRGE